MNKVLVKQFYLLNAGFFLVVITLAFGFMSGVEHRALAEFFISSPVVLLIPFSFWTLYLIKIINFNKQKLWLDENRFIFHLTLLPEFHKTLAIVILITVQFMPAIAYGVFLMLMALKNALYLPTVLIVVLQVLLISIGAIVMRFAFSHQEKEVKVSRVKNFLDREFPKPFVFFYTGWIFRREPVLLLGTKLFSGAILFGVTQLYMSEQYDWRLLAMGTVVAASANYMLITQLHLFENLHFLFLKNLPIPKRKRMIILVIVFSILCLPEFVLLSRKFPENLSWYHLPFVAVFILSFGVFYYALHYLSIPKENVSRWILGSVVVCIVIILFNVPLPVISVLLLTISAFILQKKYFAFEFEANDIE